MRKRRFSPLLWSSGIFAVCLALALYIASGVKSYVESGQVDLPEVSLLPALAYFLGAALLIGLIFYIIRASGLKLAMKIVFTLLFAWGLFTLIGLFLPLIVAIVASLAIALVWLFLPRIWLHNLLLAITLAGVGSNFGFLFSPWTLMIFMLLISVYDFLAVRIGYMLWLADKLTQFETLPAFLIPRRLSDWNLSLKGANLKDLLGNKPDDTGMSVLGGGDIGLPLLLVVSIFAVYGITSSLIVAAFGLLGLISAFGIQQLWLKGKPMPALPPISLASFIGFLLVIFVL